MRGVGQGGRGRRWLLISLFALLGLGALSVRGWGGTPVTAPTVGRVNGEPIDAREFAQAMLRERALVMGEWQRRGAAMDAQVWLRPVDGVAPLDEVRRRALAAVTRRTVERVLARQAGLIGDLRYATFLADLDRENARRREVVARGGVVYGPVQYDEAGYADYRHANLVQAHLRSLAARPRTSAQLRAAYGAVKERRYRRPGRVTLVELRAGGDAARLEQGRAALQAGQPPQAVARRFGLTLRRQTLDGQVARGWAMARPRVLAAAQQLPPGGVSAVLADAGGPVVVQVRSRDAGSAQPFGAVVGDVRLVLAESEHRALVEHGVRSARLELDHGRLNAVGREWWAP